MLAVDPQNAGVHNNLGTALCDQGRLEEAEASYRLALTFAPGDAEAHNNLGTLLYQQGETAPGSLAAICCFMPGNSA